MSLPCAVLVMLGGTEALGSRLWREFCCTCGAVGPQLRVAMSGPGGEIRGAGGGGAAAATLFVYRTG